MKLFDFQLDWVGNTADTALETLWAGIASATGESHDAQSDGDADPPVETVGGPARDQEDLPHRHGLSVQQQPRESAHRAPDVRLAGVAHIHGLHRAEDRRGAPHLRHGDHFLIFPFFKFFFLNSSFFPLKFTNHSYHNDNNDNQGPDLYAFIGFRI